MIVVRNVSCAADEPAAGRCPAYRPFWVSTVLTLPLLKVGPCRMSTRNAHDKLGITFVAAIVAR